MENKHEFSPRTGRILRVIDVLLFVSIIGLFVWLCVLSLDNQPTFENSTRTTTIVFIAWMSVIIGVGIPFTFLCFYYKFEPFYIVLLQIMSIATIAF